MHQIFLGALDLIMKLQPLYLKFCRKLKKQPVFRIKF